MDYASLAQDSSVQKAVVALGSNNFAATTVDTGAQALEEIKKLIPQGASVMNGSSTTLNQIGFVDYLKEGAHGWNNLHATILAEKDPQRQAALRAQSVLSDFYLGSAHAVTEDGKLMIASNSGSQLPHLVFTSPNIILVVSTKKIVPTLTEAFDRIEKQVIPLEDERMKGVYGFGTLWAKTLILNKENAAMGRKIHVIFVKEDLGF